MNCQREHIAKYFDGLDIAEAVIISYEAGC